MFAWLCFEGWRSGLLGAGTAFAFSAAANTAVLSLLVWKNSRILRLSEELEKRASAQAEDRSAQMQAILDRTTAVVYIKDLQGRYLFVNQKFEKLFHVNRAAMVGKQDHDLFPKDLADDYRRNDERALREKVIEIEELAVVDGKTHSYISNKFALEDRQGRPYATCGISTDITELNHLHEHFAQAQKMESISRLTAGITHDFNNLLTIIISYATLLKRNLVQGTKQYEAAEQIGEAGQRGAALTKQLLAFSRKQVLQPQAVDLNGVITSTGKMLGRILGEDVELVLALAGNPGTVKADPVQIEQILLNLAVNARDAMPRGGKLTIETAGVELGPGSAGRPPEAPPGPYVLLTVSDTGCGMSQEVLSHIFEPFFTTKGRGKGTGLGLSTVYGIVRQSGGHIEVSSETDKGTAFKIYFPRSDLAAQPSHSGEEAQAPQSTRETALRVEPAA